MTLPGIYRGVCVDPRDPQGLGRIRVQVPRVLGKSASGWAFPAWSGSDLTVWPEDRIPKAGQGVLVIFESPDRMVWISMFGPQEFSVQPLDDVIDPGTGLPVAYQTGLSWELPLLPIGLPATITGNLLSVSGPPSPPQPVSLQVHPPTAGPDYPPAPDSPDWSVAGTSPTQGRDLAWSFEYTRQAGEDDYWYRVTWPGSGGLFWPAATEPEQIPVPEADSSIAWDVIPDDLQWFKPTVLSGTLLSSGSAVEGESIRVYSRHYTDSWSPWTLIGSPISDYAGRWSMEWTWPEYLPYQLQLEALYPGNAKYDYSITIRAHNPAPSVPVNLAWTYFPEAPVLGTTHTLTGTVGTTDYRVPAAIRSLVLRINGEDRAEVSASYTGAWQINHTFTDGVGDYEVRFTGSNPYQAASTSTINKVLELQTTTSAPILPATIRYGQQITATGTVRDEQDRAVDAGPVALMRKGLSDADWSEVKRSFISAGSYSIQTDPITDVGQAQWRADYLGVSGLAPSSSTEVTRTVKLDAPVVTQRSVTYSSVGVDWSAIPGASGYQVRKVQGGATTFHTTTDTTYTATGVPQLTDVSLTVRAYYTHPQQGDLYSDWSNTRTGNTGRDEVRKTGSFSYLAVPSATATWRSADAWSYNGTNLVQGYYSDSSRSGFGVATYNSSAFQQWVIANHGGQATVDYLAHPGNESSWYAMWMNYTRLTGSGSGSAVAPLLWVTPVIANQGSAGTQYLLGGTYMAGVTPGGSADHSFPYQWWGRHVLMNDFLNYPAGTLRTYSLCIYYNGTGNYAKFSGFNMTVYCNYNYVTVSRISPSWKA